MSVWIKGGLFGFGFFGFLSEYLSYFTSWLNYLSSLAKTKVFFRFILGWNLIDLLIIVITFAVIFFEINFKTGAPSKNVVWQSINTCGILLTAFRALSRLRFWKEARKNIRMVVLAFTSSWLFLLLLTFLVVVCAVAFYQFDAEINFIKLCLNSLSLLYSTFEWAENLSGTDVLNILFLGLFVVLLNMWIPFLGTVFEKVRLKGNCVSHQELVQLISESMNAKRTWRALVNKFRKSNSESNRGHLFYFKVQKQ